MTRIKFCGMMREADIAAVNEIKPDYIGFIFWEKSRRNLTEEQAAALKAHLDPGIQTVGVFVDAPVEKVAGLLKREIIDIAQLHGHEDEEYIRSLRSVSDKPIWQAFRMQSLTDAEQAGLSTADLILADAGTGCGQTFDWKLLEGLERPFLLAGGLSLQNIEEALETIHPYGVDVSSGIETDHIKDPAKMRVFAAMVRTFDDRSNLHDEGSVLYGR